MPILGKRKYINDRIEKLINKLDTLGYDTEYIKRRFYDIQEETNDYSESSGSILPYRNKINDVLKMIEEVIKSNSNINTITTPEQFKNDLIEEVKERQMNQRSDQTKYYSQPQTIKNNDSVKSFSLGYY